MRGARSIWLGLALAAGCSAPVAPPGGPIAICAADAGLTLRASRAVEAGHDGPVDATPEEARAINDCLVRSGGQALTRTVTQSVPTPEREGAGVISDGTGYRGSVLVPVRIAPVEPVAQPYVKPATGPLPLPTGYALLPGDAELWTTLTRAEQERALLFLMDGSTIRASLRTE